MLFLECSTALKREKETSTQVFFGEISKVFKNTFLTEHLQYVLLTYDKSLLDLVISFV